MAKKKATPKKTGKERKANRRVRRQIHGTYDLEKAGIDPAESKRIAAAERAAPAPMDGELFTGPASYIKQDIKRVIEMNKHGAFTQDEWNAICRRMGELASGRAKEGTRKRSVTDETAVKAFSALITDRKNQQEAAAKIMQTVARLVSGEDEPQQDLHLHVHNGESQIQKALQQIQLRAEAGKKFEHYDTGKGGNEE